ncbi:IclR family transcriptional regulator [Pusillimonas sp. MFBS29]|uniref:IclR family transcriptional regulator n=1 Tax=Pusillimonas sp. MFBS29 TaxID=2886690 RepID=UPI001D10265C|nr:IclR family transcriptional regulator [Pusillimonas sp. MFBS29]MCC2597236.1 IclR family transcriptional regulator [Pusillimonas sp. MFBS29]
MDKTLAKGLSVLEFLVNSDAPCSVSDVARAFSLVPSNAHRTLKTLLELGYIQQVADSRYEPSLYLFELGSRVVGARDIRQVAHQAMSALASDTLETIHLVVRDRDHVIYLDKVDSPQPVAAYSRIGGRAPAQCVASGKVLLAMAMPANDGQILSWLQHEVPTLEAHTTASHTTYEALRDDLCKVRELGYAMNSGEWRADVSGLGAPVFDSRGVAVGALGISLPSVRATPERLPELIEPLCVAAATTSELLGYRAGIRRSGTHY